MTQRLIPLLLTAALVGLAAPAQAAELLDAEDMPLGRGSITFGAQASTSGLLGSVRTAFGMGGAEFGASLMAPVSAPLSFFTADGYLQFVGQTGSFLPINLMPIMGFGMATTFRDLPTNKLDLLMWMYMPVGLRYVVQTGGLSVGAEALYHLPALYMIKGQTDPARWHFEVTARAGRFLGGAFYELGPVYNGPGARVGVAF